MINQDIQSVSIKHIYQSVFNSLKRQPKMFISFLVFAVVEALFLIFIYLIPREPFVRALGPIIKTFWGENYLHYPLNFVLLPRLASISRNILTVILGSLTSGIAVAIVYDTYLKKPVIQFFPVVIASLKKYASLFSIVFITTIVYFSLVKAATVGLTSYFIAGHPTLLSLKPVIWFGPILIGINLLIGIFIQAFFTYAIPLVMIDNLGPFKAIIRSFGLFTKWFRSTLILVVLPIILYIPIIVLQFKTNYLIENFFPETVLIVSFLSIIISSLVIDFLITVSTTQLFLIKSRPGLENDRK